MPRRAKRPEAYRPRHLDEEQIFCYLDSLANFQDGGVLYPSWPLLLSIIPHMEPWSSGNQVVVHSPPPSDCVFVLSGGLATSRESGTRYNLPGLVQQLACLNDGAVGRSLLKTGDTLVPLHTVRSNLEVDVNDSVWRELSSIAAVTGIGFAANVRPDGRKYRYSVYFSSSEFEASAIQQRLLSHTLVRSVFPRAVAPTNAGVGKPTDSGDPTLDIGFQAGDQVLPLEEVTADGVDRLGAELDLQYGTVGCFIWGLDQLQSHQQTGYGVTLQSWKLN